MLKHPMMCEVLRRFISSGWTITISGPKWCKTAHGLWHWGDSSSTYMIMYWWLRNVLDFPILLELIRNVTFKMILKLSWRNKVLDKYWRQYWINARHQTSMSRLIATGLFPYVVEAIPEYVFKAVSI